jgi:hypothetical protein
VAGEFSPFEQLHGFSINGVDLETSILPAGWRERLGTVRRTKVHGLVPGQGGPVRGEAVRLP